MLDNLVAFTHNNGSGFPNTGAVNASGGAATDGTEFIANMVNDGMWGWMQALLNYNGLTPNGIVEADGASQILDALKSFTIPGVALPVFWNNDPVPLGIRAILMTGQGIIRANYSELDAIVYVGDGNNGSAPVFYHADDAAGTIRNTAGIYLILPDARGQAIRGFDPAGSVDPDGASRDLGGLQLDALQRITGDLGVINQVFRTSVTPVGQGIGALDIISALNNVHNTDGAVHWTGRIAFDSANSVSPNPAKTNDIESRMTNLAANWMITY